MNNGQFCIDESLVKACGKLMLLDRMLTELKTNGHKVLHTVLCICFFFCATEGCICQCVTNIIFNLTVRNRNSFVYLTILVLDALKQTQLVMCY